MSMLSIVLVPAVALVIFICVWRALRTSALAEQSLLLAAAVTVLCLLGMFRHAGTLHQGPAGDQPGSHGLTDVLLLLYAALGISIVFVLLLAGLARIVGLGSNHLSRRDKRRHEQRMPNHRAGNLNDSSVSRRHVKKSRPSSIRRM